MANVSSHVALYKPATTRIINWVCGTTLAPISTTQGPDGTIEISLADFGTAVNDIKNRGVQLPKQTDRDFSVAIEHRTNATEVYMVIEGNTPSQETLSHIQFTSILQDAHTRLRANGSTASATGSTPHNSPRFHVPQPSSQVASFEMRNIFDNLPEINCESASPSQPSPSRMIKIPVEKELLVVDGCVNLFPMAFP